MFYKSHYLIYALAFGLAVFAFAMDAWGRFKGNWDAIGKMFLAIAGFLACIFLYTSCTFSPDQAQAYAGAAHTLVHGALIDAKDASSVYNNIKEK